METVDAKVKRLFDKIQTDKNGIEANWKEECADGSDVVDCFVWFCKSKETNKGKPIYKMVTNSGKTTLNEEDLKNELKDYVRKFR